MGFRTSFYHMAKTEIKRFENMSRAEYYDTGVDNLNGLFKRTLLMYDYFTDSVIEISDKSEYCSSLFKSDMVFKSIIFVI